MRVWKYGLSMIVALVAASGAFAQQKVPNLQDLIGARGGDGEYQMQQRGYTYVRTEKTGDSSFTYWRESRSDRCVAVRTTEGRYASIVYAPDSDCGGGQAGASSPYREDKFGTVCGAIVDGQTYRYRCTATDFYSGAKKVKTLVEYPDQKIELIWKGGNNVELRFEGMVPKQARFATAEGETNWVFEGKTYFYISNKDAARMELEHFQD